MHPWNEPVLQAFRSRLERLPHALLIHGARGVGKLALAERMAQLLLCEHADAARRPCGECDGCRWFMSGSHPDFRRLEPEALAKQPVEPEEGEEGGGETTPARRTRQPSLQIRIEQVRELADFLNLRSHRGRLRIALIHPAEDMNENAANALLKGLEEPPAGAVFILVSHRPARLPPTIRSRCVALPVPLPPRHVALGWLASQNAKDAERWLAYAGGAPLKALDYAAEAPLLERLLQSPGIVEDREGIERLTEALQKIAVDRAFSAFGLPPKYRTGKASVPAQQARAWIHYARWMGENRALSRHPLNPKLFSAEMVGAMPKS
ncbi:MAG TPA: DNA polymerase III subunit delta' [Sphingomicrobium sp.]|nr:DNA polymerase III subunit delta' [Sphingomicrobium sp.]